MSDKCPDCQVSPGERHEQGCDVARCSQHGYQALQCDECWDLPWTHWTGTWPGIAECREYGIMTSNPIYLYGGATETEDLNTLTIMGFTGELVWDPEQERLIRP